MMKNVFLIPPADNELEDAIEYYNDQLPGLGDQFYKSFQDTVRYIAHQHRNPTYYTDRVN